MLQDIQNIFTVALSFEQILGNTVVALLCGSLIALFYRMTYRGPAYSDSFVHAMVLLCMITALVIMVIGSNLARAFGLVGAMSIIRFRTAVKDTNDIVFIFFALAAGMGAGAGLHLVALSGTILVGLVALVLSKSGIAFRQRREFLLQFAYSMNGATEAPYLAILQKFCRRHKLVNMKSQGDDLPIEMSFYVNLKDESRSNEFIDELRRLPEVSRINLFFDEEHF